MFELNRLLKYSRSRRQRLQVRPKRLVFQQSLGCKISSPEPRTAAENFVRRAVLDARTFHTQ
jgi:hypothetical protein